MRTTLEPLGDLAAVRPAWEELAAETHNPFASWDWASAWYRHMGEGRPLHLLGVRARGGRLAAILPLFLAEASERVLRLLGDHDSDLLGPICAPADRTLAFAALRAAAREMDAQIVAAAVPVGALRGRVVAQLACPTLDLSPGWDAFVASRSRNWRQKAAAEDRRLHARGRVRVEVADDPQRLPALLDVLLRLHEARFQGRSRSFAGARADLHREWSRAALDHGWLRLRVLEVDGVPVAANYAFRVEASEWYYQSGRDPAWNRNSVGRALQLRCIQDAADTGATKYRLLRGDEPYKTRLSDGNEPVETVLVEGRA